MSFDNYVNIYPKYFETNGKYVYGSVENWLIVYARPYFIKTNENRGNVYNTFYATHLASKLKVKLIIDKFNPTISINYLKFSQFDEPVKLKRKYVTKPLRSKLKFYHSVEVAFYQDLLSTQFAYSGPHKSWYDNGRISSEGIYLDNERNGKWQYWHNIKNVSEPETKSFEVSYLDGVVVANKKVKKLI